MDSTAQAVDVNLLDLSADLEGQGPPHALGRRLPAMVAELLRAAGIAARHASATVPLERPGEPASSGWAVVAGALDEGKAIELSRRMGPARLLAFGQLGPQKKKGMTLRLRVLRRGDAAEVLKLSKDFFEEEVADTALALARALAGLLERAEALDGLDVGGVLGTGDSAALLSLQAALDSLVAVEGRLAGADPTEAIGQLLDALARDPRCRLARDHALSALATHAGGLVTLDQALALARRLAELLPGDVEVTLLLARLHLRRREVGRAVEVLGAALRSSPKSSALTGELARVLGCDREQLEGAADPSSTLAFAELLTVQGRAEAARELLEAAIAHSPADHRLRALLGGISTQLGDLEAAEAAYREALGLAPNDPALLSNLAVVLSHRGQLPEAEAFARRSVALGPADPVSQKILDNILGKN